MLNINLRPIRPTAFIVRVGDITSSIKYNNLKDGKAIAINIKAGVIVQISSRTVPWVKYLCAIGFLFIL